MGFLKFEHFQKVYSSSLVFPWIDLGWNHDSLYDDSNIIPTGLTISVAPKVETSQKA